MNQTKSNRLTVLILCVAIISLGRIQHSAAAQHNGGGFASHAVIRALQGRQLIGCDDLLPAYRDAVETSFDSLFGCTCNNNNIRCTSGRACCGGVCGVLVQNAIFSENAEPLFERNCFNVEADAEFGALAGEERCIEFDYCGGFDVCDCDANISGQVCNSCAICDSLPFELPAGAAVAVQDCSNLGEAGVLVTSQCSDYTTTESILDLPLTPCIVSDFTTAMPMSTPTTARPTSTPTGTPSEVPAVVVVQPSDSSGESSTTVVLAASLGSVAFVCVAVVAGVGILTRRRSQYPDENAKSKNIVQDSLSKDRTMGMSADDKTTGVPPHGSRSLSQHQQGRKPSPDAPTGKTVAMAEPLSSPPSNYLPEFKDQVNYVGHARGRARRSASSSNSKRGSATQSVMDSAQPLVIVEEYRDEANGRSPSHERQTYHGCGRLHRREDNDNEPYHGGRPSNRRPRMHHLEPRQGSSRSSATHSSRRLYQPNEQVDHCPIQHAPDGHLMVSSNTSTSSADRRHRGAIDP